MILNPQEGLETLEAHLQAIDLKELEPDPAALNHVGEIRWTMISDTFLLEDDDPPDRPPGDFMGVDLGGVNFKAPLRRAPPTLRWTLMPPATDFICFSLYIR